MWISIEIACFLFVISLQRDSFVNGLRLINKVAIIGSGTAGLGLAAALKQLSSGVKDITVFESRADFLQSNIGGGVQLSGGAAVLEKMGCLSALESTAHRMKAVRSRNSFGTELLKLDVTSSVNDKARKELCSMGGNGQPMVFSIMRDALQHLLYNATQTVMPKQAKSWSTSGIEEPTSDPLESVVHIKAEKKCIGVIENDSTGTVCLKFEDGTEEDGYDMVFGADGVGSVLRQFTAFKDDSMLSPYIEPYFSDAQKRAGMTDVPIGDKRYTGLRITYGITPVDNSFTLRPGAENTFHQWFGSGCYALTASYGGLEGIQHMIAVVYRDDRDSAQGGNAAWNGDKSVGLVNTKQDVTNRLRKAGLSSNKEIKDLLNACEGDRFIDLGVRDNTVPLRGWSSNSGRVVLIGDSAHAMAPFLGQGANQALQDAYLMAQEIADANRRAGQNNNKGSVPPSSAYLKEKTIISRKIAKSFENKRKLPTGLLSAKSGFLGALETLPGPVGGLVRDLFFVTVGKLGVAEYIFLDGAKPNPSL